MKIVVCVKYVPDTAIKVKIAAQAAEVDLAEVSFIVNPYDEFAVEEALQLREKHGGEVIVVGAGSEGAAAGLRTCLAMGADAAVLVSDGSLERADSYVVGTVLAAVCRTLAPDLILFGKHAIGVDNGQVPAVVAEALDLPQVSVVTSLEIEGGAFRAERDIEGAHEIVEGTLPAVLTAQKGLNVPRYASLKGIMAAKKKQIEIRTVQSLGLATEDLQPRVETLEVALPPSRPPGKILKGDVSEVVPQLVKLLHEEAKII
ncbi:MAG: electron transfer flavoprotein subunit beta/FixA family protein [Acidobacteriota bacterium]|jgi:electron transfer flavoprotein beta subunit|nr:electron transfer flavoprotein subunit beta/FixA family protein [Acidobacteriota bacterium]NLT34210.1 electron transfer flavoprotein subunit beta/FixA family protein [Acidobacteriota bacterium]